MRKYFMVLTMVLALAGATEATAQQPKSQQQEQVADTPAGADGLEAYSDTTTLPVDSTLVSPAHRMGGNVRQRLTQRLDMGGVLDSFDDEAFMGMLFVLAVLFIIFVVAPVTILLVLFYFIHRNRKERIRLAQMAVQNGQPIPDTLIDDKRQPASDTYQLGMRQLFAGIGLMVLLGYAAGNVGFGVGALVACIGLGKVVIAKTERTEEEKENSNNQ